ncbi:hypothetical protein EVJ58_g10577, partial [Rhodofomes roseus]
QRRLSDVIRTAQAILDEAESIPTPYILINSGDIQPDDPMDPSQPAWIRKMAMELNEGMETVERLEAEVDNMERALDELERSPIFTWNPFPDEPLNPSSAQDAGAAQSATASPPFACPPADFPRPLELPTDPLYRQVIQSAAALGLFDSSDSASGQSATGTDIPTTEELSKRTAELEALKARRDAITATLRGDRVARAKAYSANIVGGDDKENGTRATSSGKGKQAAGQGSKGRRAFASRDATNFRSRVPRGDEDQERRERSRRAQKHGLDMTAVSYMSDRFKEGVAAGTMPFGSGTKEEIQEWLNSLEEKRRKRNARTSQPVFGKMSLGEIFQTFGHLTESMDALKELKKWKQGQSTSGPAESLQPTASVVEETNAEPEPAERSSDEIVVPVDDGEDVGSQSIERGRPAIRRSQRPARGGKVCTPVRRQYVPRDRRTEQLFQPRDLPSMGDVTTTVRDTMREEIVWETEFRHAPLLLNKIEADRRAAVYARWVDAEGRPIAGPSRLG